MNYGLSSNKCLTVEFKDNRLGLTSSEIYCGGLKGYVAVPVWVLGDWGERKLSYVSPIATLEVKLIFLRR